MSKNGVNSAFFLKDNFCSNIMQVKVKFYSAIEANKFVASIIELANYPPELILFTWIKYELSSLECKTVCKLNYEVSKLALPFRILVLAKILLVPKITKEDLL